MRDGRGNIMDADQGKPLKRILFDNIFTFFNFLNFALAACLLLVGSYRNMLFITIIIANILIGTVQEYRAQKTIRELQLLNAPDVHVLRGGREVVLKPEETVQGDIAVFRAGDQIIADAVGRQYVTETTYDRDMVLVGYGQAAKCGIGRACFSARILNQFAIDDKSKIANYILGACLQSDVAAIRNSSAISAGPDATIIVAGKNPFRRAIADILVHEGYFRHVEEFAPASELPLSPVGAYRIADLRG